MLNTPQIRTMLALQNSMNLKVNEAWLSAGSAWHRAILVEASEAIEHHGWKWWKKQEMNLEQLQMEMIDIWHFGLSFLIVEFEGDLDLAIANIRSDLSSKSIAVRFDDQFYVYTSLDLLQKLDLMAGLAAANRFDVKLFMAILTDLEMTGDELFRQYVGKNVLNFFRQDHGYKEGSYEKTWLGREDNEHLVEIMNALNPASESFKDDVYAGLKERYSRQQVHAAGSEG